MSGKLGKTDFLFLLQQLGELVDQFAEQGEGIVDGLGGAHIHACDLQQGHGIGGAAAGEGFLDSLQQPV